MVVAAKKKKKSSELQFVYEEENNAEDQVQETEIIDEDDAALEFSAATVIGDNPLLTNAEEAEQNTDYVEDEDGVEFTDEAAGHNTATVVHLRKEPSSEDEKAEAEEDVSDPAIENKLSEDSSPSIKMESSAPKQMAQPVKREVTREVVIKEVARPATHKPTTLVDDAEIQAHIYEVKTHAEVKVALAEFKAEFLAEHLGEAKALEFQIKQLLRPLAKTNNPAIVKQVAKIQKLLELHAKGTIELVKEKAKNDKIVKPTQDKVTEKLKKIKKAA